MRNCYGEGGWHVKNVCHSCKSVVVLCCVVVIYLKQFPLRRQRTIDAPLDRRHFITSSTSVVMWLECITLKKEEEKKGGRERTKEEVKTSQLSSRRGFFPFFVCGTSRTYSDSRSGDDTLARFFSSSSRYYYPFESRHLNSALCKVPRRRHSKFFLSCHHVSFHFPSEWHWMIFVCSKHTKTKTFYQEYWCNCFFLFIFLLF